MNIQVQRKLGYPIFIAAFALLFGPGLAIRTHADAFVDWQWRNPIPQGLNLNGVAHGNGITVAVANAGRVLTSVDDTNWVVQRISLSEIFDLASVTFGNGRFVVVGGPDLLSPGPPLSAFPNVNVYVSTNGLNWSQTLSKLGDGRVTFGNGQFAVLLRDPVLDTISPFVSSNGVAWTAGTKTNIDVVPRGMAFGNGRYVAITSGSASGTTLVSSNGTTWSQTTCTNQLIDIAFDNGWFYGAGTNGVFQSVDGVSWTESTNNISGPSSLTAIAVGGNRFVAQGSTLPPYEFGDLLEMTSDDGANWTTNLPTATGLTRDICWTGQKFVAVGDAGRISLSSNGLDWVHLSPLPNAALRDIAYGQETLVAVGGNDGVSSRHWIPGRCLFTSLDGNYWTTRISTNLGTLFSVAHGNALFIAVGADGMVLRSVDATNWLEQNCGSTNTLKSVVFAGGKFVAVGMSGTIVASPDGTNWSVKSSGVTSDFTGVTYGDGLYVAVGTNGLIATSSDGDSWTQQVSGVSQALNAVTYANGLYVAVGNTRVRSTNGVNWVVSPFTGATQLGIGYVHGVFFSVGLAGSGFVSPDGTNWTARALPPVTRLSGFYGLLNFRETLLLVGDNGAIVQSAYFGPPILSGKTLTNGFQVTVVAEVNRFYRVLATTNFVDWSSFAAFQNSFEVTNSFLDTSAVNRPLRFYRVVSP